MAVAETASLLRFIRSLTFDTGHRDCTDRQLLRSYLETADEAAFSVLLQRHAPMVYGVCRRILDNDADADDVFQATFVVLSRRARSIRRRQSLGSWLHGVALRTAQYARRRELGRRGHERTYQPQTPLTPTPLDADVRRIIDEELEQLHERYRAPLVLCYFEGKTNQEAALQLGWPVGTVCGRLARARRLLRTRLMRRGLAPAVAAMATTLTSQELAAVVPLSVINSTSQIAALALSSETIVASGVSSSVVTLAEGVLKGLLLSKVKTIATLVLSASFLGIGAGVIAQQAFAPLEPVPAESQEQETPADKVDLYGDPLPAGATARFGSIHFRHARLGDFVFAEGGRTIVTAGSDRVVRFWDAASGKQVRQARLQGTAGPGRCITLSPDGSLLAALENKKVYIWDVESGKEIDTVPGPEGKDLGYIFFSPDNKLLAIGSRQGAVLWDLKTKTDRSLDVPIRKIGLDSSCHCQFSTDGNSIVVGMASDLPVCVFDIATGRRLQEFDCQAFTSALSPDNKTLAACCRGQGKDGRGSILRIFDVESGKQKEEFTLDDEVAHFSITWAPNGKTLACSRSDKSLLFDVSAGRILHRLTGRAGFMQFSPDSRTVAATTGYRIRRWDVATGKELNERPGELDSDLATAISPDGRFIASAGWVNRTVSIWQAATGKLLRQLPLGGEEKRYVRALVFSADGKTLTAFQAMGFIQSWDIATGEEKHSVQIVNQNPQNGSPFIYKWNTDGKYMFSIERAAEAAGPKSTRLSVWDAESGAFIRDHLLPGGSFESGWSPDGVWSPDAKTFAPSGPQNVVVLDPVSGKIRHQLAAVAGGTMAISPDGRLLAAANRASAEQGSVTVWELLTGQLVATITTGPVRHVALGVDNQSLITIGDAHLCTWDLATGKELGRWDSPVVGPHTGRRGFVTELLLHPDGKRLFTALADGTGLNWDISNRLASRAANRRHDFDFAAAWKELGSDQAARAYSCIWQMAASGDDTVAKLAAELKPVAEPDIPALQKLVADLDNDSFEVREKAFAALKDLGEPASAALQDALERDPPLESRRRIEAILVAWPQRALSMDGRRALRAVTVLEMIASTPARELLIKIAAGAPSAPLTKEAKAAIKRIQTRGT